jgi:hypothetical protein
MMRLQFVRNYVFIFDNRDGSRREEPGQIELSDDDEALAFAEQVIREMTQGSTQQYKGCAMEVYEGDRTVCRIPLSKHEKPLSTWPVTAAAQRGSEVLRSCRAVIRTLYLSKWRDLRCPSRSLTQGGNREPNRRSFSARANRID